MPAFAAGAAGDRVIPGNKRVGGLQILLVSLDSLKNFHTVNRQGLRRLDPDPDFITANLNDGKGDVIAEHNLLVFLSG